MLTQVQQNKVYSELKTLEWWISGLMLGPLFFLISRLNNACSPLVINLLFTIPTMKIRQMEY